VQLVDQALHLQALLRALEEGYGAVQGVLEGAEKKEGHVVRALNKHTQYQTVRSRLEVGGGLYHAQQRAVHGEGGNSVKV
jgi:hypothetical protein